MNRFTLTDCVEMHAKHPDTFDLPSTEDIRPGDNVKVIVATSGNGNPSGERIWVLVKSVSGDNFSGTFNNDPMFFDAKFEDPIEFERRHICNVLRSPR